MTLFIWVTVGSGLVSMVNGVEVNLAIVSAYTTHLAIDSFTKEGIYTYPKGFEIKRWVKGLSKGDTASWGYWRLFRIEKIKGRHICRSNDDPILNTCISLPSLLIIIIFVAVMPMPV